MPAGVLVDAADGAMTGEAPEGYRRYLASPRWRTRRRRYIEDHGAACERCTATESLHLHHKSYSHVGDEPDRDLVLLCERCHSLAHAVHHKFAQVKGHRLTLRQATDLTLGWSDRTAARYATGDPHRQADLYRTAAVKPRSDKKAKRRKLKATIQTVRVAAKTSPCAYCDQFVHPGDRYQYHPRKRVSWHEDCDPRKKQGGRT